MEVRMNIFDVVEKFNTTPFLFLGSGITRRYYNLPDWKGLLEYFARQVKDDDFTYSSYENRAAKEECQMGILPKVAELIQFDYDEKWFSDETIRTVKGDMLQAVKDGLSPFKAEVAEYIRINSVEVEEYKHEIELLEKISIKKAKK
jgi:hypothetical protein